MIAEFYIIGQSFEFNGRYTTQEVQDKIKILADDFIYIRQFADRNKLFIHPSAFLIEFLPAITLIDILSDPDQGRRHIERDVYNALLKIFVESAQTDHTVEYVTEHLLTTHTEDQCAGLIAFHKVPDIDDASQIVYNRDNWLSFRRYFLALYPRDGAFFVEDCKIYFPNLFFHERTKATVEIILHGNSGKIVRHLGALNDNFRQYQDGIRNRTDVLRAFSIGENLDETATLEGNARRRNALSFSFQTESGVDESVYCQPHIKLPFSDQVGDTAYSNNRRIYFHEGRTSIAKGKILIGHIGVHL